MTWKTALWDWAGRFLPLAEWDWRLRLRGRPLGKKSLQFLQRHLAEWVAQAEPFVRDAPPRHAVALFTVLDRWLVHGALMALGLAARGYRVTYLYLPYRDWFTPVSRYALWQREAYLRHVLAPLARVVQVRSLWREAPAPLPPDLDEHLETIDDFDMQYTLQREQVPPEHPLWGLRRDRNRDAARRLLGFLQRESPRALLVPNGLILEFGVAHRVGRYMGLPVMSFEFDEQKEYMWLSQDEPVMRLHLDEFWAWARQRPLSAAEEARIRRAMQDRWQGRVWERSMRRWQYVPPAGAREAATRLGLDLHRPIFLLAPNVFGDSVVLGAQVFSRGLSDWMTRTVEFFARHPRAQLVVRVHPGEKYLGPEGLSMSRVVREAMPAGADNIVVVEADAPVNTFDLVPLATAGLVYTSTVGLEMVLWGKPVVVAGKAFYRGKGFTLDPNTWDAYFALLAKMLEDATPWHPTEEQQALAWRFAHAFLYEFPRPSPWHMTYLEDHVQARPPARVLAHPRYTPTWDELAGKPLPWKAGLLAAST